MISAATPAAAGVAALVPSAKKYPLSAYRLPGLSTKSNTPHGSVRDPVPRARVQLAVPWGVLNSASSPPGAAKETRDLPKFVYDAGRSKLVAPSPNPSGPVAAMAITCGDSAGRTTKLRE